MLFQWLSFFALLCSVSRLINHFFPVSPPLLFQIKAYLYFDYMEFITNPAVIRMNCEIKNVSNVLSLDLDVNLLQNIDGKQMVHNTFRKFIITI
jgi:hypothetical protein